MMVCYPSDRSNVNLMLFLMHIC